MTQVGIENQRQNINQQKYLKLRVCHLHHSAPRPVLHLRAPLTVGGLPHVHLRDGNRGKEKEACLVQCPVPSGYPYPTRYTVCLSISEPTRLSFGNHRVAGNPKHWVLPNISGKPKLSGTTQYFGYHPKEENNAIIRCFSLGPTKRTPGCKTNAKSAISTSSMTVGLLLDGQSLFN